MCLAVTEDRCLCSPPASGAHLIKCSIIVEGVKIEKEAVLGANVVITASTKIIDRATGKILYGRIPKYSVVVPGSLEGKKGINLYCAVIVKTVDAKTRSKTSINDLLRN